MNIDQHIKNELEQEQEQLTQLINQDQGLFSMVINAYQGSMKWWMVLVSIFAFLLTILLLWTGYEFFNADSTDDRVFWGFICLASVLGQGMLKQWTFMEMNRVSVIRSVKHLEMEFEKLSHMINQRD
jgi:dolichyl-phosphate-mannose--protein O-mannosyl transferase